MEILKEYVAAPPAVSQPLLADVDAGRRGYLFWKRTQDILFSTLALVLLLPLFLVVSLLIVLDSPGAGPIFVQERIGKNGKPFRMVKFRSMCPNAEKQLDRLQDQNEMDGPVFKIRNDPRITRVGRFIRKTNIDELPQLLNIIKGDMSIIGPRPALPKEVEQYTDFERQRLLVRPGLSCYWQIVPDRNEVHFSDWMRLDVQYINDRSFLVDWKIIFRSIAVCLKATGV